MTLKQEKAIDRIRRMVDKWNGELQEVKKWNVELLDYSDIVYLFFVIGYKDDEGKMTMLFRDHVSFFIGVRGGVWYYPYKGRTRKYFKIGCGIGTPIIDQSVRRH